MAPVEYNMRCMSNPSTEHPTMPNGESWNVVPFSDLIGKPDFTLSSGMAITGVGGFGGLDIIERRAVTTIDREIARRRNFQWPPIQGRDPGGFSTTLATEWRPKGFHGRLMDSVVYVPPFDEQVAATYGLEGHLQSGALCVPLVAVGILAMRGRRLMGFAGSAAYHPQRSANQHADTIGHPISRKLRKPLGTGAIAEVVAAEGERSAAIGSRLAALAMSRPYPGGSMSGGKRS